MTSVENLTATANHYQINDEGETELFTWHIGIRGEYEFNLLNQNSTLGIGIFFPKTSEDELYDIFPITLSYQADFGHLFGLKWFYGLGFYNLIIKGSNETVALPNGGSTSTFYGPKSTKFNYYFVPELGMKKHIFEAIFFKFTLSTQDILEDKRSYNYFLSIMWRL